MGPRLLLFGASGAIGQAVMGVTRDVIPVDDAMACHRLALPAFSHYGVRLTIVSP